LTGCLFNCIPKTPIGLWQGTDEAEKIRAGKVRRLHARHFTNQLAAALDHKVLAAVADTIE
jgi:hypothetical protein